MFGTFTPETKRPTYGLTQNKDTYNVLKLQYGDYAELWRDVRAARSWRDKLGYLFRPPGWQPSGRVDVVETPDGGGQLSGFRRAT